MTMGKLRTLLERAESADAAADQLHADLAEAERETKAERARRVRDAWQEFTGTYDPAALRQAVVDAHGALRGVFGTGGDLAVAMTDYAAAMLREQSQAQLARHAIENGATLPEGVTVPEGADWPADAAGKVIGGPIAEHLGVGVTASLAAEVAAERIAAEAAEVTNAVQAAHDSVEVPRPDVYRVVAPFPEDRTEMVGATFVHFAGAPGGAVAYLDAGHPALPWYTQHEHFEVIGAYAVPARYKEAVQRMAPEPDAYAPAGSPRREYHPHGPGEGAA
jgi:hypothetical protein